MKQVSSSFFQHSYNRLNVEVEVTVHGRVIGVWTPVNGRPREDPVVEEPVLVQPRDHDFSGIRSYSKTQQAGRKR